MLKVIKGTTITEQIQSIDALINSLFERRYSLAVDLIPPQVVQELPICIKVPAGKSGTKAFSLAGKITKLTCTNLQLKKDTVISVSVISDNQSIVTRFTLPSNKIQETELIVPEGAEVDIELLPAIEGDICVGLVFTPDQLKKEGKVK
jgi:hypothetical protein